MPSRNERLMPGGIPKYVRIYRTDDDDVTVVYTGPYPKARDPHFGIEWHYRSMDERPFHPQGVGLFGFTWNAPADVNDGGFAPPVGRKHHFYGRRITWYDLNEDQQALALDDYKAIWRLEDA